MTEKEIQDYVMGTLPPAEAEAVAKTIAGDPDLQRVAEQYEVIFGVFRRERAADIEIGLNDYEATLPDPGTDSPGESSSSFRWPWWLGGFLLCMLVASAILFWPSGDTNESLTEAYFEKLRDPRIAGVDDNIVNYNQAIDQYFSGDYSAAVTTFSGLVDDEEYGTDALFYLPHAAYWLGDYEKASSQFRLALENPNLSPSTRELLRWNAMVNDLARGEDITDQLNEEWTSYYRADELRAAWLAIRK